MTGCEDVRWLLGSHTLGGLAPSEAEAVERHLAACPACRREHVELAVLPSLLDLVEPESEAGLVRERAPSPGLEHAVLEGYAAHRRATVALPRRRRRWSAARVTVPSALAGAAVAIAVVAVTGVLRSPVEQPPRVALRPAPGAPAGAHASAELRETGTGTDVDLDVTLPGLRAGEVYELWFVGLRGRVSAGTFTVARGQPTHVRLSTAARSGSYRRVGITREPDGLDPARNGPTVASAVVPETKH